MYTWGQPRLPNMNDSVTSFLYHPESSLLDSMFRTRHFLRVFVGHVQLAFGLSSGTGNDPGLKVITTQARILSETQFPRVFVVQHHTRR
mmetsp:Transcript_87956/g.128605  ORF Transcript_87956/g.128605 Transcript_87956/m.128605 type:complete len:89 (-) Transcript_87956:111-377(-)